MTSEPRGTSLRFAVGLGRSAYPESLVAARAARVAGTKAHTKATTTKIKAKRLERMIASDACVWRFVCE
jgi:hypothetical protein